MVQLADSAKHPPQLLWLNLPVVLSRQFAKLRLDKYAGPDAEADKDKRVKIEPDGPLPCLYHSLEAALCADGWMTETFAYDWRKHIENRGVAYALKNLILCVERRQGRCTSSPTLKVAWSLARPWPSWRSKSLHTTANRWWAR